MYVDQTIQLKAQITGGLPADLKGVSTWYSFYAQSGDPGIVIKENTRDATVLWVPKLPGYYSFSVNVRQSSVAPQQATAALPGPCEVKKVTYDVTLNVSPSSGQAEAPPSDAKKLKVSASVSGPSGTKAFRFVFQKMNSGVVAQDTLYGEYAANWTPNPPQPAEPGLYRIAVQVVKVQGDVVVAEGMKEINYYEVKPARAGGVPVSKVIGDMTMVKPSPTSQVSLTVTPLPPSPSTSPIVLTAAVAVPGNPSGVSNKFTFSYAGPGGSASQTFQASGTSQGWTLSPQPPPGTYNLVASVETRRTADNAPLAQGSAQIANYVVAGATYPYGWIFPVTTQNTTLAVGTTYGSATNTIAGNSVNAIVDSAGVRVRADNAACASCHGGSFTQSGFCSAGANYLTKGPHAGSVQPADQTLSNLFKNWIARNCPN
jgi:hypothetical protein